MRHILPPALTLAGLLAAGVGSALAAQTSGAVQITLPPENARLKPGPGMETTANNCMICHSVDYIYMQPPLTRDQWHAEVMKMKKVFGAPLPDNEVDTVVDYLMSQNGKK
ncbi:MAG: cytochrome c [Burkholderiales bacterium]